MSTYCRLCITSNASVNVDITTRELALDNQIKNLKIDKTNISALTENIYKTNVANIQGCMIKEGFRQKCLHLAKMSMKQVLLSFSLIRSVLKECNLFFSKNCVYPPSIMERHSM